MRAVFNPVLSDDVLFCFTQIINQSDLKLMDNDKEGMSSTSSTNDYF